ncbi:hypothetical protein HY604_00905 [Candidatus Peregrinibacteria bacterium]|nr:hypothetical protein [Candidatus Peregrinibacteria bacterium]
MAENVKTLDAMRSEAEDLLTAAKEGDLAPADIQICADLAAQLTARAGVLYQDSKTQSLALVLFALARSLRALNPASQKQWGQEVKVVSAFSLDEPIVDLERSPWGISNLVAARLEITLNGEIMKVTNGVRVGLQVVNKDDERAARICKGVLLDLDMENLSPKKYRARMQRAKDLRQYMDQQAPDLASGETSRVAWTQEGKGSVDAQSVHLDLCDVSGHLALDGSASDVDEVRKKRDAIWTMVSIADTGKYSPVQVGSVRGGERKHKK